MAKRNSGVEGVVVTGLFDVFAGRSVLVTGHTGFKGSWLCEWLLLAGARVTGLALPPEGQPSLFEQLRLAERIEHECLDVTDAAAVTAVIQRANPDFVFHLAAQSLVRRSYREPVLTYLTNIMGTVNVLDAFRGMERPCVVVVITTDKCYENLGGAHAYREIDRLGGRDPYSSSKACAELAVAAYRESFFSLDSPVSIATARAGNVIGGGDWAEDRIVPDAVRALQSSRAIPVRNPDSHRPWQHVLEPLGGYMMLASRLWEAGRGVSPELSRLRSAFNFGPDCESQRPVRDLVLEILGHWPGEWEDARESDAPHEAELLHLANDKARDELGWRPCWDFRTCVSQTVAWYHEVLCGEGAGAAQQLSRRQIEDYTRDLEAAVGAGSCGRAATVNSRP